MSDRESGSDSPPERRRRLSSPHLETESEVDDEVLDANFSPHEHDDEDDDDDAGQAADRGRGAARRRRGVGAARGRVQVRGSGHKRGAPSTSQDTCSGRRNRSQKISINNDLLIQLVQERPALWDQTMKEHSDHIRTTHLWEEIFALIIPDWENISSRLQDDQAKQVRKRWRSIRDRFTRDIAAEKSIPSGSGATNRPTYRYMAALNFLRPSAELRQTTSSTRRHQSGPEPVPEVTCHIESGIPTDPGTEAASTSARSTPTTVFERILDSNSSGHRRKPNIQDLIEHTRNSFIHIQDVLKAQKEEIAELRKELREAQNKPVTPAEGFCKSILPEIELMTQEEFYICRTKVNRIVWEIRHPPQPVASSILPSQAPLSFPTTQFVTNQPQQAYLHPQLLTQQPQLFSQSQPFQVLSQIPSAQPLPLTYSTPQSTSKKVLALPTPISLSLEQTRTHTPTPSLSQYLLDESSTSTTQSPYHSSLLHSTTHPASQSSSTSFGFPLLTTPSTPSTPPQHSASQSYNLDTPHPLTPLSRSNSSRRSKD